MRRATRNRRDRKIKMMTILDEIVVSKQQEVATARQRLPLEELLSRSAVAPPVRNFRAALAKGGSIRLIAEIKKASPSAQVIRPQFDPVAIARIYEAHDATCLSVLTDAPYFQGHIEDLMLVPGRRRNSLAAQGLRDRRLSSDRGSSSWC